jgi:hypothetical protein
MTLTDVVCAVVTLGPPIVAGWLVLGLGACWAWSRIAARLLTEPRWYRCDACQVIFLERVPLVDHIIAAHPELLPRIDA